MTFAKQDPFDRFWAKVEKTETCWLWTSNLTHNGYPTFWFEGKTVRAHRWIYEQMVGPIPEGWEVDHVKARGCTSYSCVNPAHLEAVTTAENNVRIDRTDQKRAPQIMCQRGLHVLADNRFPTTPGCTACKAVRRILNRKATH